MLHPLKRINARVYLPRSCPTEENKANHANFTAWHEVGVEMVEKIRSFCFNYPPGQSVYGGESGRLRSRVAASCLQDCNNSTPAGRRRW